MHCNLTCTVALKKQCMYDKISNFTFKIRDYFIISSEKHSKHKRHIVHSKHNACSCFFILFFFFAPFLKSFIPTAFSVVNAIF